jgi:hypothetical protein
MSTAAASRLDTAPESNPLVQGSAQPTPEIEKLGAELSSRIQRALVARHYEAASVQQNGKDGVVTDKADARIREVTHRSTAVVPPTSLRDEIDRKIRGVFPVTTPVPKLSLQPLQEWEGYVTEIASDRFTARLTDVTAGRKFEEELADFPISDLSDDDRDLLKAGAIFRWVIGYQRSGGGTKRRVSQITFRRLPAWTRADLERAKKTASILAKEIVWD